MSELASAHQTRRPFSRKAGWRPSAQTLGLPDKTRSKEDDTGGHLKLSVQPIIASFRCTLRRFVR
jgi:hypothetical protein